MRNLIFILIPLFLLNCAGQKNKKTNEKHRGKIHLNAHSKLNEENQFGIQVNLNLPNSLFVFQKNNDKFEANYQLSIAILDSIKNQIQHHSWQETKSVSFFEETRSEAESISTGHFFNVNSGNYSISILIEDLDSKYRWHKNIPLKNYKTNFISATLINTINENTNNYAGNVIPEKTDKINLKISYQFEELIQNSYLKLNGENDNDIVFQDSISIKNKINTIFYDINLSEFWLGELKLNLNYGELEENLTLILPGKNSEYWHDINTTIHIMSYILSSSEIRQLRELSKDDKIIFIKNYWKSMDPSPETDKNEVMEEFFSRVDYSLTHFAEFGPGWQSDRGRIYILYGPPEHVELANQNNQGYKYEIWHYPSGKQFIFIDEGMFGNFRLYREIN